jgi:hypothetical protein
MDKTIHIGIERENSRTTPTNTKRVFHQDNKHG